MSEVEALKAEVARLNAAILEDSQQHCAAGMRHADNQEEILRILISHRDEAERLRKALEEVVLVSRTKISMKQVASRALWPDSCK